MDENTRRDISKHLLCDCVNLMLVVKWANTAFCWRNGTTTSYCYHM